MHHLRREHLWNQIVLSHQDFVECDVTPMLAFVNCKSGGRQGRSVLEPLRKALGPLQVCDVTDDNCTELLSIFTNCSDRLKVLCCGGDGTINSLVSEFFRKNMTNVGIGIVPIGTGNDLTNVVKIGRLQCVKILFTMLKKHC